MPEKCQRLRIRKNAHKLTQAEIQSLRFALDQIIQSGKFQEIANYHGAPYGEICPQQRIQMGCCKHTFEGASAEDFLAWHRLYMGKTIKLLSISI